MGSELVFARGIANRLGDFAIARPGLCRGPLAAGTAVQALAAWWLLPAQTGIHTYSQNTL